MNNYQEKMYLEQRNKTPAYVMLRGKKVLIEKIHSVESLALDVELYGEIPVKIKSRCLEKAMEFCERRVLFRRQFSDNVYTVAFFFDRKFLKDVKETNIDLVDLFDAALILGIVKLMNLLFEDVVDIICSKTPEEVEKIFKIRYNDGDTKLCSKINFCLNSSPPCPTLSKDEQEDVKRHRETIMKKSPADFKTLPPAHKRYWVYAHLILKSNPAMFITTHSKEDVAEDDEEEEYA